MTLVLYCDIILNEGYPSTNLMLFQALMGGKEKMLISRYCGPKGKPRYSIELNANESKPNDFDNKPRSFRTQAKAFNYVIKKGWKF